MNPEKPLIERWKEQSGRDERIRIKDIKKDLEKLFDEANEDADHYCVECQIRVLNLRSKILGDKNV